MNAVTKLNYPVDKLPADLRGEFKPGTTVTVVIRPEGEAKPLTRFVGRFGHLDVEAAEAVARVRSLRDEWEG